MCQEQKEDKWIIKLENVSKIVGVQSHHRDLLVCAYRFVPLDGVSIFTLLV